MSSRSLSLLRSVTSHKPCLNTVSRTYVSLGPSRPYAPRNTAVTPSTSSISPQRHNASTTAPRHANDVQGNPETINKMPTTAREIEDEVLAQAAIAAEPTKAGNGIGNVNGKNGSSATEAGLDSAGFPGLNGGSESSGQPTDWSRSYHGLSVQPFEEKVADVLLAPVDPLDVEMKPDGMIYLPEIKYRRVLNKAFGPGGWGLAPRSETNVGPKIVSREYALVCLGRLVAIARGEQEYFDPSGIPTATEACKSNALMRCCKDLGVASELWDPRFIREFKAKYCVEVFAEHLPTKKKRKMWRRKDQPKFSYPFQE